MMDSVSDPVEMLRDTTTVGVRVPARHEQLVMLRALAETVSLIADFGLDEVTDIRLALDEVATALITVAVMDTSLSCDFDYDGDRMTVRVTSISVVDSLRDQEGFAWHIVRTLTRAVSVVQHPYDVASGGYPTDVEFSWFRRDADGA